MSHMTVIFVKIIYIKYMLLFMGTLYDVGIIYKKESESSKFFYLQRFEQNRAIKKLNDQILTIYINIISIA